MKCRGEKQRTAIARALITEPQLILAHEPTGALDSRSTDSLLRLFRDINEEGRTILMVTHSTNASFAKRAVYQRRRDLSSFTRVFRQKKNVPKIADTLTMIATGGARRD